MPYSFEIYTISVVWDSPQTYRSYKLGTHPLKPTISEDNIPEYDFVIYTKEGNDYFQICIKTNGIPILKSVDENNKWSLSNQLYNIDKDLWIIKGDWDKGQRGIGYHKCPSINKIGKLYIGITFDRKNIKQELTIDVNPNIEDFDFNILKNDFEGELWDLLTLNKSKSNTQTNEIRYGAKVFRFAESKLIIDFLNEFQRIIKNPKRELKYTTTNQPYTKVKPIPATFKKLARSGISTTLPSKSHEEDFDIYENRYLCLMLYQISQIVNYNFSFSQQNIKRLKNKIDDIEKNIANLQDPPPKNPNVILNEINKTEQLYTQWLNKWKENKNIVISNCDNANCKVHSIVKILYKSDEYDYWVEKDGTFCLMCFPADMSSIFEGEKNLIIKIKGFIYKSGNAGRHPEFTVKAIETIEFVYINTIGIIKRQKQIYEQLKNNNWKQVLTQSEIRERDNQISTLKKKSDKTFNQIKNLNEFTKELTELKPFIDKYLQTDFFKSIDIKKPIRFKPSMTFIQNVNYRNAQTYYYEILKSEGVSIDVFGLFELITNYGIREIPQVYELWCLISTIKVLNSFGFNNNANDLHNLLSVITPDRKKIDKEVCINFSGNLNDRSVKLYYQKKLADNKRPDFFIEIKANSKTVNLILDAKFKNYNYKKSASIDAIYMYEKYGNYTFTLHPTSDKIWNEKDVKLTNFGGDKIYDENNNVVLPFHKYGFLMIKPNQTDNLKKIIGMALEYLIENNHNAIGANRRKDPKPELDLVCLSCGSTKVKIKQHTRGNNRYYYECECENKECGHKISIDYCWNCKTKLFKHGSYWDYHKTSIWSIFDIHCPNCGMTVADKP